ncbi:MAG TPA: DM13 domain-containing protein [Pseudonocardiaceae bacterium]
MSNEVLGGRKRLAWAAVAVAAVIGIVLLLAFEPWKLVTSSTIDEAMPDGDGVVTAEGRFVSQAHETSGVAQLLTMDDGSQVLRFENLRSDDGPDLHVWLTDQPAGGGTDIYDDGRYVELGDLKATNGNQNYPVPAGIDLTGLRSVVIWCDRFNTAFGSAPIEL